jgi:exodeoxyribonuclease VII small subunit
MARNEKKADIPNLNFEQAIKELTGIVNKIEQGEVPLQESLEQYERGMSLIQHCRTILKRAEERIEKISESKEAEDGRRKTENRREGVMGFYDAKLRV